MSRRQFRALETFIRDKSPTKQQQLEDILEEYEAYDNEQTILYHLRILTGLGVTMDNIAEYFDKLIE